jgi:hypothetical protein
MKKPMIISILLMLKKVYPTLCRVSDQIIQKEKCGGIMELYYCSKYIKNKYCKVIVYYGEQADAYKLT